MWKKKIAAFLLCAVLLLSSPPLGFCATYTLTEEQLQTLEEHLTKLEANNSELSKLLSQSEEDLTLSLTALNESRKQLTILKAELLQARIDTDKAHKSLETVNIELRNVAASLKKSEAQKSRIKSQRTIWQIVAAGLLMWGVSR